MPEGDTIHKLAASMRPLLVGKELAGLRVRDRGDVDFLRGATVESVDAIGKHLIVRVGDEWGLRVHLGMKGRWRRYRRGVRIPQSVRFASVVLRTESDALVCHKARDVELVRGIDLERNRQLVRLGPDLLAENLDLDAVIARARRDGNGNVAIAELLLDQRVAAGIGNVYKSEALFLRGVHPRRRVSTLDDDALRGIYATARELMRKNVPRPAARRTVWRPDRRSAAPEREPRLWVYGRVGQPCMRCGDTVVMEHLGDQARSTYHCPTCQPGT